MSGTSKYSFSEADESLLKPDNDTRNVVDEYRGMPVAEIAADMAAKAFNVHIAIENYQHDMNIGTIVRNANAFNVASVHIVGKHKWNRRGAMSTEKYLQVYHHPDVTDFENWAKNENLSIVGIDNIPGSIELAKAKLPENSVLVFGQEGPGLSADMQAICEQIIAIEQFGSTRSVNVGVASGIILYEWVRRNKL